MANVSIADLSWAAMWLEFPNDHIVVCLDGGPTAETLVTEILQGELRQRRSRDLGNRHVTP